MIENQGVTASSGGRATHERSHSSVSSPSVSVPNAQFRPLSDFIAEVDARGIAEHGWIRWRLARLRARLAIKWWKLWHHTQVVTVSQAAFDAVAADRETLDAIAASAMSTGTVKTAKPAEGRSPASAVREAQTPNL